MATAGGTRARVLWIEDDESVVQWGSAFLRGEGFSVETEMTGAAGLARACTGPYDLIILDWALPDIGGSQLLDSLRAVGVKTPVMVLTGRFTDGDSAAAFLAGANDFQRKPVRGADWVRAIEQVLEAGATVRGSQTVTDTDDGTVEQVARPHSWSARACTQLDMSGAGQNATRGGILDRERLEAWFVCTLIEPDRTIPELIACGRVIRLLTSASPDVGRARLAEVRQAVAAGAIDRRRLHPVVIAATDRLESATCKVLRIREETLALELGIDPAHLGRLLHEETNLRFRVWTFGARLRPAVLRLANSREQVAQIAFRCGWNSLGQFDRDFRRLFGLSPTRFRALVAVHRTR
jgi:CheY-like chemotaxis protein/AraC-like DNA-binding protein